MIPYFFLIGLSRNELQMHHFLIPFLNIFVLIKQLIYGIYKIDSMLYVDASSIGLMVISFFFAFMMFCKSKWVLGKS